SGMLDFIALEQAFVEVLGRDRVQMLPVEWIRNAPEAYSSGLLRLGFSGDEIAAFLGAKPENVRASKSLDKIRPWAFRLGAWADRNGGPERFPLPAQGPFR